MAPSDVGAVDVLALLDQPLLSLQRERGVDVVPEVLERLAASIQVPEGDPDLDCLAEEGLVEEADPVRRRPHDPVDLHGRRGGCPVCRGKGGGGCSIRLGALRDRRRDLVHLPRLRGPVLLLVGVAPGRREERDARLLVVAAVDPPPEARLEEPREHVGLPEAPLREGPWRHQAVLRQQQPVDPRRVVDEDVVRGAGVVDGVLEPSALRLQEQPSKLVVGHPHDKGSPRLGDP
mmetsp:Transcript_35008/g.83022  ORF Transcript_35008/g.83022 Transcript_35008/m.83022 type:complete len:233 (+) Transcript_35008:933-1631(+)